jgi:hypothetical protein
MADLNIDKTDPAYQTMRTRFDQMKDAMRPLMRRYRRMTMEQRQIWRDNDERLDEILTFCERVTTEQEI